MRRVCFPIWLLVLVVAALVIGVLPADVWGQSASSASIVGKVTDESGAAMPNVAIKVTSPALQVAQVAAVTDADGSYKVLELPAPGMYRISFELAGFQTYVRDGLTLSVGFSARIDVAMKIGAVTQTVEVTGESPVVDTVSTAASTTIQLEQLQSTPRGSGLQDMLPLAAGVSLAGPPDVGDSNLASRSAIITYGVILQPTLNVEGINTTSAHQYDTAVYLDAYSIAESQFKSDGNNADVGFPGVAQIAVIKSGSNSFHGGADVDYENPKFQGTNITAALAGPPNNLKVTSPILSPGYHNISGQFGGRIIRDKLWFFIAATDPSVRQGQVNGVGRPDPTCPVVAGSQNGWNLSKCPNATTAFAEQALPEYDWKVSYQAKPKVKLIMSRMWGRKYNSGGGSLTASQPSATFQYLPASVFKGEMQAAPSNRLLVDVVTGFGGYFTHYFTQPVAQMKKLGYSPALNPDYLGDPSQIDSSNLVTGPALGPNDRPQNRFETNGSLSFIPSAPHFGGTHQLKFGTTLDWEFEGTRVLQNNIAGDYQLVFSNNFGVGVPSQIVVWNFPVLDQTDHTHSQAFYVTDSYTIKRVTINAGVRAERYNTFVAAESKVAGQFSTIKDANGFIFPAASYATKPILIWKDIVPRLGAAWDVKGNGKTVVKASAGLFGDTMGDRFATNFNPNNLSSNTYNWNAATGGTCFDPGLPNEFQYDEFKCDVNPAWLNSTGAFAGAGLSVLTPTSQTGGAKQILNPTLKQNKTFEYVLRFERQLVPNVALSAGYVQHRIYNMYDSGSAASAVAGTDLTGNGINIGRPYSAWTPVAGFVDGQTGAPVPVYTYPAGSAFCLTGTLNGSTLGCTSNEVLNNPYNRPNTFHSFELTVTKRYSKRWDAMASFWETKNHRWIQGVSGSPNDDRFPIDNTWNWEARGTISYHLPRGFEVSSFYRAQSGRPGQRTQKFTNAATLQQTSVTLRMGPYGEFRGPVIAVLNLKVAKNFNLGESRRLQANFQIFNLLNNSAANTTSYLTGATFGVVTDIVPARVYRIGAQFNF